MIKAITTRAVATANGVIPEGTLLTGKQALEAIGAGYAEFVPDSTKRTAVRAKPIEKRGE